MKLNTKKLRLFLKVADLTQNDLANFVGVTPRHINSMVNGHYDVPRYLLALMILFRREQKNSGLTGKQLIEQMEKQI